MKDHIRDYSTASYRFYAQVGGPEKFINALVSDLVKVKGTGECSPTEAALIAREEVIISKHAELHDLDAVDRVLATSDRYIRKAIEYVYFKDPDKDVEWGDIQDRVHYAEIHIPASERQIYYWLSKARRMFAIERGLRL